MKIIDDKGRLFGLINIIDFAVIMIAAWIGSGFGWYVWKLHKAPKSTIQPVIEKELYDIKSAELEVLQAKLGFYCKKHKRAEICREEK